MYNFRRPTIREAWSTFTTDSTSSTFHPSAVSFFKEIKPILLILRAIGRLPCTISDDGIRTSSLMSVPVIYTVAFYVYLIYVSAKTLTMFWHQTSENRSYKKSLELIIMISFLCQNFVLPIVHWVQMPKLLNFLRMWSKLESEFRREFSKVGQSRAVLWTCVSSIPISLVQTVITTYLFVDIQVYTVLAFVPVTIASYMITALWCFSLFGLRIQARSLRKLLIKDGLRKNLDRKRRCWLMISQMTSGTGDAQGAACGSLTAAFFIVFLISIYGFFSSVFDFREDAHVAWTLAVPVALSVAFFFLVFECSGRTTKEVGVKFTSTILLLKRGEWDQTNHNEVPLILLSTYICQPNVKFSGFLLVNRYLFGSLAANTLTFLFVLIQFKH